MIRANASFFDFVFALVKIDGGRQARLDQQLPSCFLADYYYDLYLRQKSTEIRICY